MFRSLLGLSFIISLWASAAIASCSIMSLAECSDEELVERVDDVKRTWGSRSRNDPFAEELERRGKHEEIFESRLDAAVTESCKFVRLRPGAVGTFSSNVQAYKNEAAIEQTTKISRGEEAVLLNIIKYRDNWLGNFILLDAPEHGGWVTLEDGDFVETSCSVQTYEGALNKIKEYSLATAKIIRAERVLSERLEDVRKSSTKPNSKMALISGEWWKTASQSKLEATIAQEDVNASNRSGRTPLMFAATSGKPEQIAALIKAGANINARNENGYTALMFAAAWGTSDAVMVLLDAGADPTLLGNDGKSIAAVAKSNERLTGSSVVSQLTRIYEAKVEKLFPLGNVSNLRPISCSQNWKIVEGEALEAAATRIAKSFKGCHYSAWVHWQDMQPNFGDNKKKEFSRNLHVRIGLNNLRTAPGTRSGFAGWKLKEGLLNDPNHRYGDTSVRFTVGTVKEVRVLGASAATGECDVNVRFRLWFSELTKIGSFMIDELGKDSMTFSNCYRLGLNSFEWIFNSIDEF